MIEALTMLRVAELEEGDEHPADLPRDELVKRLCMTDTLARERAGDLNAIAEARARLAFTPGAGVKKGSTE